MRLDEILNRLGEPQALEAFQPHWEESLASLGDGVPSFLTPEEYRANRDWCGFGPEVEPYLDRAAERILADRGLTCLAWHCHRLLFEHTDYMEVRNWPYWEKTLGDLHCVFYLLVVMGMVPTVRRLHQAMGVPEEVTRETLSQVSCVAGNYRRKTGGGLGVTVNTIYWMRHYPAGRLFRLGRMEYKIEPYHGNMLVYRHRETSEVVALAPDGMRYNGEGYVDGTAGNVDEEHGWTAALSVDEEGATGYPISPCGMAVKRLVRLPVAEWECVLKKGDLVLDMHIPAGGKMSAERCGDSMRRGTEFFRRFFPDKPFRVVHCTSWIFNTQLEQIEPRMANLLDYQHEIYLYPVPSSGRDGLWFIFLRDDYDPATLPRDTSLRRGVADFLAAGNAWRMGAMFYVTDDLEYYGSQHYRSHWPPAALQDA